MVEPLSPSSELSGQAAGLSLDHRELRIAPVLTGGTSLAVWIGGVTAELYRLVDCGESSTDPADDPYRALRELTATRPVVDVVTGTSAGGLNGVLLSTAWVSRTPASAVVGLRDVWMRLGSLDALVRRPRERNPRSLLRGDDYFWPQVAGVLQHLAANGRTDVDRPTRPVDLMVTVTTMVAEPTHRRDGLGVDLGEVTQAHSLQFTERAFGPAGDRVWSDRLALAARTSASIPGVFEASFLPVGESPNGRPDLAGHASFSVSRWAVDGGLLDNLPLGKALNRVFNQPASGEVRRVALYVNPTPKPAVLAGQDRVDEPPTLVSTVRTTSARVEGVSDQVDRIADHNRQVAVHGTTRRSIARLVAGTRAGSGDGLVELAEQFFDRFVDVRTAVSPKAMIERLASTLDEADQRRLRDALTVAARAPGAWLPESFRAGTASGQRRWMWESPRSSTWEPCCSN